jgi:hypothetical protein
MTKRKSTNTHISHRRTSLTPPLVIELHVQIPLSERSGICVLEVSNVNP